MDYKDDNVWLMFGDCLERMKEIPDGSVDAVISDIPYGISYSSWDVLHDNKNSALLGQSPAQKSSALFEKRGKPLNGWSEADRNKGKEFSEWCAKFLTECMRVLKPASPLLVMTGRQLQHRFTIAAEDSGFVYKDYLVWDKMQAPFRAQAVAKVLDKRGVTVEGNYRLGNLAPMHEPVVYLFKPYKQGGTVTDCFVKDGVGCFDADILQSNIIRLSSKVSNKEHETQKPVQLFEILVELVTKEGHTVLDMFMGSGTTGVACKSLNRKFIGIEMDEGYYEVASKRILEGSDAEFSRLE